MLNQITVMGRLTKDPELRYTQQQRPVATFTVAVNRDLQKDETDFIDCVAWNGTAEFISRNFRKGGMAIVTGSMQSRKWEDRDGNKRISWNINVSNIYFGEPKKTGTAQLDGEPQHPYSTQQGYVSSNPFENLEDDGDIPF